MRNINLLLLFVVISNISQSQNRIEYQLNNIRLIIYTESSKFIIKDKPDFYRDEYTDSLTASKVISGKVLYNKKMIDLIDSDSKFKIQLKKIDKYRVLINNRNLFFKYKEILCPNAIYYNHGKWIQSMGWKNGIRQGEWRYQTLDGYKFEIYDKGKLIKLYYQTYKQITDSIKNLPGNL